MQAGRCSSSVGLVGVDSCRDRLRGVHAALNAVGDAGPAIGGSGEMQAGKVR